MKKSNILTKYSFLDSAFLDSLGIIDWGYTTDSTAQSYTHFDKWVNNGGAGKLNYLTDHRKELRKDIKNFFPEFKSALVFIFPYDHVKRNKQEEDLEIAGYALGYEGLDYHYWIKERLSILTDRIQNTHSSLKVKMSLDVHPILERDLAHRSGLGWFGKNSMLINPHYGSYFLIGSLLLSKELELNPKSQITDLCGSCTSCIDQCPTDAINIDKTIQSNLCISTFTIEEFKDVNPDWDLNLLSNKAFGCDICQDVCPWNKNYLKKESLLSLVKSEEKSNEIKGFFKKPMNSIFKSLNEISNREYRRVFKSTSFERLGRVGLIKNLKAIAKNFL